MIKIFILRVIIKGDTHQIVETEGYQSEVEDSTDRIIEENCNMLIIIEITLGEIISEGICIPQIKTTEVRLLEVTIEVTIEMITLEEVEVGLETEITEGVVVVDQGQYWELVLIGIELDARSVGYMIISLKIAWIYKQKNNQNKYSKCII